MSSTALLEAGSPAYAERESLPAEPTDHALVAAIRAGDDRAFEQLFARYQRRVAAYVYGMVSDHGRAEDITQEIFISALRRMRETERPIAFRPWIYEIAKNACIDQFRRSRRSEEISYDSAEDLGAADYGRLVQRGPTPDVLVDQKQALHDLTGAFGGLSETHHRILVLRELEGLSYREIGDRLDMSRASVESTLFRARRRLSEEYDDLASGQRCMRIQSLLGTAAGGGLGTRDARRFARHVSHCQACRLQARMAGVDAATMARRPRRAVLGSKLAGLLPFPAFLRTRRDSAEALVTQWTAFGPATEPLVQGWSKVAAAAATVALAGVGAGVGSQVSSHLHDADRATTAPAVQRSAPARTAPIGVRPLAYPASPRSRSGASRDELRSTVPGSPGAKRLGGAAPGAGLTPAGKRPSSAPSAPRKRPSSPAASNPAAAPAPAASAPAGSGPIEAPGKPEVGGETTTTVPDTKNTTGNNNGVPTPRPDTTSLPPLPVPGDQPTSGTGTDVTKVAGDATRTAVTTIGGVSGGTGLGSGLGEALIDAGL